MSEFNEVDQFRGFFRSSPEENFFGRRLFDFVFPKQGEGLTDQPVGKWMRRLSYTAPLAGVLIFAGILFAGYLWGVRSDAGKILCFFHLIVCLLGLFSMGKLLLAALILKIKKRSPAILMALTIVFPVKAVCFLGFFNLLFALIMNDTTPPIRARNMPRLNHERQFTSLDSPQKKEEPEVVKTVGEPPVTQERNFHKEIDARLKSYEEERKKTEVVTPNSIKTPYKVGSMMETTPRANAVLIGKIKAKDPIEHIEEPTNLQEATELTIPLFFGWDKPPYNGEPEIKE